MSDQRRLAHCGEWTTPGQPCGVLAQWYYGGHWYCDAHAEVFKRPSLISRARLVAADDVAALTREFQHVCDLADTESWNFRRLGDYIRQERALERQLKALEALRPRPPAPLAGEEE